MAQITFATGGQTVMTTSKQHDFLNRLNGIASHPGGTSSPAFVSCCHTHTSANQRIRPAESDSSYWLYTSDALGRRVRQATFDRSSGTWQVTEDLKFVSDPVLFARPFAELNATNNALVRRYVWGLDLSGTMDGAGGVGGLLAVHDASTLNNQPSTHFVCYDGNGNIVALVSAADGSETARYEYGPFAEPIRVSGPAARANPFRFSTKRADDTTDLVLYEFRAYSPPSAAGHPATRFLLTNGSFLAMSSLHLIRFFKPPVSPT